MLKITRTSDCKKYNFCAVVIQHVHACILLTSSYVIKVFTHLLSSVTKQTI